MSTVGHKADMPVAVRNDCFRGEQRTLVAENDPNQVVLAGSTVVLVIALIVAMIVAWGPKHIAMCNFRRSSDAL
jgi:hypothetical protein